MEGQKKQKKKEGKREGRKDRLKEGSKGGRKKGRKEGKKGEREKQKAGILLYSPQVISRNDPYFHGQILDKKMNWYLSEKYAFFKWLSSFLQGTRL